MRRTHLLSLILCLQIPRSVCDEDVFSCFVLFSNRYLEKSGTLYLDNLKNAEECLQRCRNIKLQNGEACRSVMWKKDTRDCILSRHSRVDRIRHFLVAPNLEIDFYENICTQTQARSVINGSTNERKSNSVEMESRATASKSSTQRRSILPSAFPVFEDSPIKEKPRLIRPIMVTRGHFLLRSTKYPPTIHARNVASTAKNDTASLQLPSLSDPASPPEPVSPSRIRSDLVSECFVRQAGVVLRGFEERTLLDLSVQQCLGQCLYTRTFYCASVNYELTRNLCVLNGGSALMNGVQLEPSTVDYFENLCHPHACLRECSMTDCAAVNWLSHTSSCMLYSTGYNRSFGKDPQATFFENICQADHSRKEVIVSGDPDYT